MNLYRWRSNCLKNYGPGDIIVMAPTVEKAKEIALKEFHLRYVERYEDYMNKKAEFLDDIAKEPQITECIFIEGSE